MNYDDKWTISQERLMLENLVDKRLHVFFVIFAIILGGAFASRTQENLRMILTLGGILCILLWVAILRAHNLLCLVRRMIKEDKAYQSHPSNAVDKEREKLPVYLKFFTGRGMIVKIASGLCVLLVVIAAVAAYTNRITVA